MQFIKATSGHIDAIAAIYGRIIDAQEQGRLTVGWQRGVYPTRQTALDALGRGDLFVCVDGGQVAAAAIINRIQVPVYAEVGWLYHAEPDEVMVLHTLVVDPLMAGRGYGTAFVAYYESYAKKQRLPGAAHGHQREERRCPQAVRPPGLSRGRNRALCVQRDKRRWAGVPGEKTVSRGRSLCIQSLSSLLPSSPFFSITTALPLAVTAKTYGWYDIPPVASKSFVCGSSVI